jgi:DNA repair protein RadA/Sms
MVTPQGRTPDRPRRQKHEQPPLSGSLLHVPNADYQSVPLSGAFAWLVDLCGQFVQGGVYVIDGAPATNKSTLARQLGLDLAAQGHSCLYVLTEEPASRLKNAITRLTNNWTNVRRDLAMSRLFAEADVQDLLFLPRFLARKVLSPDAPYRGVKMIVIDSINGTGLRPSDTERWQALYEFAGLCRSAGITVLLISHVNKRGEMAGPRSTEHNIDCALRLRKSGVNRHLGITKNRFGPECHRLLPLEIDPKSIALRPSKHVAATAAVARSYLPGVGLVELQAAVSLPPWGSHPRVMAPNLPRKEVELLLSCLSQVPGLEFDDLCSTIRCRIPSDGRYSTVLGMALCIALVGSLLQRPIPKHQVFLGEIDLARSVRNLPDLLLTELAQSLSDGTLEVPMRLVVPRSAVAYLPQMKGVEVVPCGTLDDAITHTFPKGGCS